MNRFGARFFGRVRDELVPGRVFFNWSASGFEFRFTGTQAQALLATLPVPENERAWVGVYVDGDTEATARFPLTEEQAWYTLASGLTYGEHVIRVVKLTECGYGRAALAGIETDGDAPAPTEPKKLRIEFVGDSITCGYGNECMTGAGEFVTCEENAERTYAAFLRRALNAEANQICVSGNGIWHDYGCGTHNLMYELYGHTDKMLDGHFGVKAEKWDASRFLPDIILVKLGTNDSRYCDGWDLPEEERTEELRAERRLGFREKLYGFLDMLCTANADAPVLYITDTDTVLRDEISSTVRKYAQEHPGRGMYQHCLDSKRPWEGVGANGHWSVSTHRRAARELEPVIREILEKHEKA